MSANQSPNGDGGRIVSKLTNPLNPPVIKLAIFIAVLAVGTFIIWLLLSLNWP